MAQYLYQLKLTRPDMLSRGPTPQEDATVARHFEYLVDLHARGVVIYAGRTETTDADTLGIVVLEAEDEAAAIEHMNHDPAVAGGVMTAQIAPFRTAIGAFAPLKGD